MKNENLQKAKKIEERLQELSDSKADLLHLGDVKVTKLKVETTDENEKIVETTYVRFERDGVLGFILKAIEAEEAKLHLELEAL